MSDRSIFKSDWFKEFSNQMEKGLRVAELMPRLNCPGCGCAMTVFIGGGGYMCYGMNCVLRGRRIDISEIVDSWKWNCILKEAETRNAELNAMLERNNARRDRQEGDFF